MNSIDIIKDSTKIIKSDIKKIIIYLLVLYIPIFILDYYFSNNLFYQMLSIYTPPLAGSTFSLLFNIIFLTFVIHFYQEKYNNYEKIVLRKYLDS